jgi:hypothetical protein
MSDGDVLGVRAERMRALRAHAERARELAEMSLDRQTSANLLSYACDLEAEAAKLAGAPLQILSSPAMEASGESRATEAKAALRPQGDSENPSGK